MNPLHRRLVEILWDRVRICTFSKGLANIIYLTLIDGTQVEIDGRIVTVFTMNGLETLYTLSQAQELFSELSIEAVV